MDIVTIGLVDTTYQHFELIQVGKIYEEATQDSLEEIQ